MKDFPFICCSSAIPCGLILEQGSVVVLSGIVFLDDSR